MSPNSSKALTPASQCVKRAPVTVSRGSARKFAASCVGETNTTSVGPGLVGPLTRKKILDYKHIIRRVSERAYEKYIWDILGMKQETDDLDTPPKVNTKKLFSLLKHSKAWFPRYVFHTCFYCTKRKHTVEIEKLMWNLFVLSKSSRTLGGCLFLTCLNWLYACIINKKQIGTINMSSLSIF